MEYLANQDHEPSDFTKTKQKINRVNKEIEAIRHKKQCNHQLMVK